jgi:hypothetical protein
MRVFSPFEARRKTRLEKEVFMNGAEPTGGSSIGWSFVVLGLIIAGFGLIWVVAPGILKLGRLPGDIAIEGKNTRFYFPIVTWLVISAILSLIMWLIRMATR